MSSELNPKVKKMPVGIREIREITVYPLSVAAQLNMTDLIFSAVQSASGLGIEKARKSTVWVGLVLKTLRENAAQILTNATCGEEKGEDLLTDTDNDQFLAIVEHLFEANYSGALKKIPEMAERWKPLFLKTPLTEPSPTSSDSTDSTGLKTSTGKISKKAV
jgi:hypothetical protein